MYKRQVYDLPRLIRDLPVDNAYDAVKELPGVTEMNGGLQLAGQGVTAVSYTHLIYVDGS